MHVMLLILRNEFRLLRKEEILTNAKRIAGVNKMDTAFASCCENVLKETQPINLLAAFNASNSSELEINSDQRPRSS
eukprot:gene23208-1418_t